MQLATQVNSVWPSFLG